MPAFSGGLSELEETHPYVPYFHSKVLFQNHILKPCLPNEVVLAEIWESPALYGLSFAVLL